MFFPQHPTGTSSSSGNQRVAPPSSRLSPPPGTSVEDLIASSDISGKGKKKKEDAPKRGYRACVHCRLRKARCDLGDVNSPSEPPCTRCRREQRNCVFLPSVCGPYGCSPVADDQKRRRKTGGDDDSEANGQDREPSEDWKPPEASGSGYPQFPQQQTGPLQTFQPQTSQEAASFNGVSRTSKSRANYSGTITSTARAFSPCSHFLYPRLIMEPSCQT